MRKIELMVKGKTLAKVAVLLSTGVLASSVSSQNVAATDDFVSDVASVPAATVRGVVRPNAQATLAIDLPARVIKINYREGQSFKKGDLLIEFDCRRYKAQQMGAQADYRSQQITYRSNLRLAKRSAIGRTEVQISKANMERALAGVKELEAKTSLCEIRAPYDGRVVEQLIHEFEYSGPNVPLLKIIDDSKLDISLIVPSNWLSWMREGTAFSFTVDETGKTYQAKVKQLGAEVDPVSQTLKIKGVFVKMPQRVLAGMSGTATFAAHTKTAFLQ